LAQVGLERWYLQGVTDLHTSKFAVPSTYYFKRGVT